MTEAVIKKIKIGDEKGQVSFCLSRTLHVAGLGWVGLGWVGL
jgi:hypothetical protein